MTYGVINVEGRVPPHDLNAEAATLSAVLAAPETLREVAMVLTPQDMYSESHRAILEAAIGCSESGSTPDVVSVGSWLHSHNKLSAAGGIQYLTSLLDMYLLASVSEARVIEYARSVKRCAMMRKVIEVCARGAAVGYNHPESPEGWAQGIRDELAGIQIGGDSSSISGIGAVLKKSINEHARIAATGRTVRGTPTGFRALDRMMGGFVAPDVFTVAALPGMGKTSFLLGAAKSVARSGDGAALIFSLEMPGEQLGDRLVCADAGVPVNSFRMNLTPALIARLQPAVEAIGKLPILIDDRSRRIGDIRGALAAAQSKKKIAAVFIDYLQLMTYEHKDENASLTAIMQAIQAMAKDMRVPIVLLSQFNRDVANRSNPRPVMTDLRGSGSIEQLSNNIVFIHRQGKFNPDCEDPNLVEFIVEKQRDGETGVAHMNWHGPTATFWDRLEVA